MVAGRTRVVRWLMAVALTVAGVVGLSAAPASAVPQVSGLRRALVLQVTWAGGDDVPGAALDDLITGEVTTWMYTASLHVFKGYTVADPGSITITQPALSTGTDQCAGTFLRAIYTSADAEALRRGYDIDNYDNVIYWFPGQPCGWSGKGDVGGVRVYLNDGADRRTIVHELGHTLGLGHAHTLYCKDASGGSVPLSTNCTAGEYGDIFSEMGQGYGTYSAPQLYDLHWLDGLVPTVPPTGGVYRVEPLDNPSPEFGKHGLRIPDGAETIWVEYRKPGILDYDGNGIYVHLERPDGLVTAGSYLLMMGNGSGFATFPTGVTWTNPLGHIQLRVDWTATLAAQVTVSTTYRTVPNVLNISVSSAKTALTAAGLTLGRQSTVQNCVDPGTIQIQSPAPGTLVDAGTPVSVTVSTCTGGGQPK
jgi:hypothetical protein